MLRKLQGSSLLVFFYDSSNRVLKVGHLKNTSYDSSVGLAYIIKVVEDHTP